MKKQIGRFSVLIAIFLFTCIHGFSQVDQQAPIPIAPDVKVGKLENGLTYFIRKNSRPEKKVELRLVINAGSILEDDDQQGLAHFTEHMSFNGSTHFKKNELVSFLQSIGVKFGADLNAYTSFDETVYILPIPVDKKENLEKGFLVLEDWASGVAFDGQEIDKERGVVLEESRLGKGANDRMNKIVYPKITEGSRYAVRLPIGKEEILKTFSHDAIRRFYRDWYRPDLMAVVVVGDIDPSEAEALVKSHFGKLKNPAKERARTISPVPPRTKTEAVIVSDKEATNTILQIYYPFVSFKEATTPLEYRNQYMLKTLVQSMLGTRLQELTQKSNPPFVFGGSNFGGFARGHEAYMSFALVSQAGVNAAITALVNEDARARKFGFTAPELDRSKKNLLKSMERSYNERDKTESNQIADEMIRHFLTNEPIPGIATEYQYYQQFLDGISLEEINQYASRSIPISESKLVVVTSPEKTDFPIPSESELIAAVDKAANADLKAYEEKEVATSLMAATPAPGKILSEKENKELGYTEYNLSNGIRVIIKPTDFKNDQVVMSGFRYGGQYLYGNEDRYNAEYATMAVTAMGVGAFSPTDLRKVLTGKMVNVSPRIGTLTDNISGMCGAADVEAMLQLTHLYFTQPRKDDELFKSTITRQQAMVQNMLKDPQMIFRDSLLHYTYNNHPRGPHIPSVEAYGQINEQRALDIYRERYGNANGFTFLLVGKVDLDKTKPLLMTYLASLPSAPLKPAFKDAGVRPAKGVIKKAVYSGKEPKSFISIQITGEAPYSEKEQLKLQAAVEILNIKIIESLREEMGGIYTGGIFGSLTRIPYPNYSIGLQLPCGPENVDKLINGALSEIEKIKTTGPSDVDLNKVKENWKKQYQENIKDNNFWLRQLQQMIEAGNPASDVLDYEKNVDALTPKEIESAAKKYFNMKNFIQVVLYPEK